MTAAIRRGPALLKRSAAAAAAVLVMLLTGWVVANRLATVARNRAIRIMEQHFGADLRAQSLDVRLFPSIRIRGQRLVFQERDQPDAPPLITIQDFLATASVIGALRDPPRVRQVQMNGLRIQVSRRAGSGPDPNAAGKQRTPDFLIEDVAADGTVLMVYPKHKGKPPLEFDLERLHLWSAGTATPMSFRATLTNAEPPGQIKTTGEFGPWNREDAGHTPVSGNYTFRDADLSVFHGIAGKLASDGNYRGTLDHIEVDGWTDVPDFTVQISGSPVDLKTRFHAVVDGTDGDTLLQPVDARFGHSQVTARGGVEQEARADGKTVSLNVLADGRIEDMLRLGATGAPPLTGAIRFQAKLKIPPGDVDISRKLELDGGFTVDSARFSQLNLQRKVGELSRKAEGEPNTPPNESVASDFRGHFVVSRGRVRFERLSFRIPGAVLNLNGTYGLLDQQLDFHGTARLEAKLSQTTTGFKSLLLKIIDPLFRGKAGGSVIPIHISGTRDQPKFGLDLAH